MCHCTVAVAEVHSHRLIGAPGSDHLYLFGLRDECVFPHDGFPGGDAALFVPVGTYNVAVDHPGFARKTMIVDVQEPREVIVRDLFGIRGPRGKHRITSH